MSEEENINQSPDDNHASTVENKTVDQLQNEKMEVQKHPHHVTHKKKWGEYLLEFFMLFLAVFLGFVAENVREGQVEKAKEKEYMVSLLSDLKQDTISANRTIFANRLLIAGEDSTLHFLSANLHSQDTAEMALVYFYKYCIYSTFIRISDGTISQLKNNGGLRLLKNQEVINYINQYYNELVIAKQQEAAINEFLNTIDKQAGEIFNYTGNKKFIDSSNSSEKNVYDLPHSLLISWLTHGTPTMLATDIKDLSPFMSNMSYQVGLMSTYILNLKTLKKQATDLMQLIKKEYHLENE
ncbi:MAG: hypothetical protein ABIR31_08120 [Ginsengibacter sp.]